MNIAALLLLPVLAALLLWSRAVRARATLLMIVVGVLATGLAISAAVVLPGGARGLGTFVEHLQGTELLRVDATSRLFLVVINPIFLGISVYVANRVSTTPSLDVGLGSFVGFSVLFLAAANTVLVSNHLLLLWLALEATTLLAAPLIVRANVRSSRQASWRYVLFSSVGMALVLLGILCLARGMEHAGSVPTFFIDELRELADDVVNPWRKVGLALVLFGLGTKLGLAPMYSWLPEAYDEAPPSVTALLASVQFNCALVALLRIVQLFRPGNEALFSGVLITMGIVSMVASTVSIIATRNMKRLIAYASINHAGVIAIGLGVGKGASFGLMLYVISNAFIKAILFLTAGKIKAHYRTKDTRKISSLIQDLPYSGVFLMVGTFALLGFPPFGSFVGELLILSALVSSGQMLVFAAFCVLVTMSFVATGRTIFPMIWGTAKAKRVWPRQTFASAAPKIAFLVALLALGIYIPPVISDLIDQVATSVEP
ncbi:MAG: proton-conducting transporter membrane subunit [Deltaproteobacteria bacterium]|nr:proton-conducting transporter membrane subunit [Deltaproteobacteria bacterium]